MGIRLDEAMSKFGESAYLVAVTPIGYFIILLMVPTSSPLILAPPVLILTAIFARQFYTRLSILPKIRLGLDGEVYTGQELNYLMQTGAFVYHDIPYKYGNIDHIVVSTGGIFVVETKAVRKPAGEDGKRQSKVSVLNGKLCFPGFSSDAPINQAKRHAEHIRMFVRSHTDIDIPVTPVVSLPGWYITTSEVSKVLIINPKRGAALGSFVCRKLVTKEQVDIVATLIEEVARSVRANAEKFDPDADQKYDLWGDRKFEERKID